MDETIRVAVLGSSELFRDGALELIRELAAPASWGGHDPSAEAGRSDRTDGLGVVVLALGQGSVVGTEPHSDEPVGESTPQSRLIAQVAPIPALTAREIGVLQALARNGETNRALAEELDISEATVKRHLATIFGKLGVHTRMQAVRRAEAAGFLSL